MVFLDSVIIETILSKLASGALDLGTRILVALLVLFVGTKFIKSAMKLFAKTLEKSGADVSISQFLISFAKAALYVLLAFIIASYCGVDAASIVALLGSAGVAIGLAVQGSLSNMAGGVLILLLKPFKLGDYIIDSAGNEGFVDVIHVFYTRLRTVDNKIIILPNGTLANNSITNVTTSKTRRCDIVIGISYDADIKKAKDALMQVISEDEKTLKTEELVVFVDSFGDSAINLGIRCWFNNEEFFAGKWRLNEKIKYALDEAEIIIPYPQMDIHLDK